MHLMIRKLYATGTVNMYSKLDVQKRHLLLFAAAVHPYVACTGK
jgi:hypothetical protein